MCTVAAGREQTCEGREGWLGRAAGAAPSCTRAGCPGAADGDDAQGVSVSARAGGSNACTTPARTEMRVTMATWLTAGESSVGTELQLPFADVVCVPWLMKRTGAAGSAFDCGMSIPWLTSTFCAGLK